MNTPASGKSCFAASLRRAHSIHTYVIALLMPGLTMWTIPIDANPTGGIVVNGDVSFGGGAGNLQITQGSQNAIINWADFSISEGELTEFFQPNAQSIVLNRVTGGNPSAIYGALKANGNVFVINPNGILVGQNGTIDVNGLVLSTLDVSNGEFLAGGDQIFEGNSDSGNVTNMGRINAIGGDVFLMGRSVTNNGSIKAGKGTAGLAAGEEILLSAAAGTPGGERLFVRATGAGASGVGVLNDGSIEGAAVELKAHGNMYALAINNEGSVRAVGATTSGGRVYLRGVGGTVSNSGSITATSPGVGSSGRLLIEAAYARVDGLLAAQGGSIQIAATESLEIGGGISTASPVGDGGEILLEGRQIRLESSAVVDASGNTNGGQVLLGGGLQGQDGRVRNAETVVIDDGAIIRAVGGENGGQVIVWSDGETRFAGSIQATGGVGKGGFAEVSGLRKLNIDDASFDLGQGGLLLLDPANFTVSDTVRNAILPTLNGGTDVVIYTNGSDPGVGNGDIIMSSNFSGTSAISGNGSLSLLAWGDVIIRRDLVSNGAGNLNIVAGWDGATPVSFGPPGQGSNVSGTPVIMDDQIFSNTSTYGNREGSVYIGLETDKITPVNQSTTTVGSRAGQTNVAGYNLVMVGDNTAAATTGDDRTAQLGYRASDVDATLGRAAATGRIRVEVLNNITMTAGIKTDAMGSHSAAPGQYNYVQIGHGGRDATSNGFNHSGDIILRAGLGSGVGITGNIIATGGNNLGDFVRVGHGGHNGGTASGSFSGAITIEALGSVTFTGGTGRRAFAQVGHGGHDVDAGTTLGGAGFHSGEIMVTAGGNVSFVGGIGYTGGTSGDLFVTDGRSFSMIGHGGYASEARGMQGHEGGILVESTGGSILMKAGDIDDNFSQIGHGGGASQVVDAAAAGHSGSIRVTAATGITLLAGTGQTFRGGQDGRMFAHIGHGGYNSGTANNAAPVAGSTLGHSGSVTVSTTGGDIFVYGGNVANGSVGNGLGRLHFAQIGHGGHGSPGAHHGSIEVESEAGLIDVRGGATTDDAVDGARNFAQIGHGGHAGTRGTFGRKDEVVSVKAATGISFAAGGSASGGRNFAQLGHGGYDADLSPELLPGNGGNIANILVSTAAGDIVFSASGGTNNYVQLGHGGLASGGDQTGNIEVTAEAGAIRFLAGTTTDAYALLGHGGRSSDGNRSGNISVIADQGILFQAGTGTRAFAQLGHGGRPGDLRWSPSMA